MVALRIRLAGGAIVTAGVLARCGAGGRDRHQCFVITLWDSVGERERASFEAVIEKIGGFFGKVNVRRSANGFAASLGAAALRGDREAV